MSDSAKLQSQLVAWRRHLHANPELSFEEFETAAYIEKQLEKSGLTSRRIARTGVVVEIEGSEPGGLVGVRADIDALPLVEATGLEFASTREGVMHACGHDGHTAIALGLAKTLHDDRAFPGTIRVFFQPAEERAPGGALAMIEEGVIDGCDAVIGLHIIADVPAHTAAIRVGPQLAATDDFSIVIEGGGGHASRPNQTTDPIAAAGHVIVALQSIVSRRIDPLQPAVVTVARVVGGSTYNIIPREVTLLGTLRSLDEEVRRELRSELIRVAKAACEIVGTTCKVEIIDGYPTTVNERSVVDVFRQAAASVLGAENVVECPPIMGGEDFSRYAEKVPGAFLFLGGGGLAPHHHPEFDFNEDVLIHGVEVLRETAFRLARRARVAT